LAATRSGRVLRGLVLKQRYRGRRSASRCRQHRYCLPLWGEYRNCAENPAIAANDPNSDIQAVG